MAGKVAVAPGSATIRACVTCRAWARLTKDNARRALFGWLTDKPVEKWAPATETDLLEEVMALWLLPP